MARTITRGQDIFGDRYKYDFGEMSCRNGWAQIDTWQDASYFGLWTNPTTLEIFTFGEGDTSREKCDTPEEYVAAVRECCAFYDCERQQCRIDAYGTSDKFRALGLGDLLH